MRTSRRGFTLIELMVAIAIAGVAITAGYGALTTVIDQRSRIEAATAATSRAWALRETLADWIAGSSLAPSGPGASFRGVSGMHERVPDAEVTFFTSARTPLGDGGTVVRLFVARDAAGIAHGLAADLSENAGPRHATIVLDSTIAGLEVRYRSSVFSAAQWLDSWISRTVLPSGVELTLHAAGRDSIAPLLRVPMTVALEGGR